MAQISTWIRQMVPGRQISARVLGRKNDGTTSLDIGGHKVDARISRPVAEGTTVRMRVTHADKNRIALKELTFANHPVGRYLMALRSLGRQGPFQYLTTLLDAAPTFSSTSSGRLFEKLQHFFSKFAIKPDTGAPQSIREMVRRSGLTHERQLLEGQPKENAKSLALELQKAIPKNQPIAKTITTLVESMEKLQVVNRASHEASGRILIPLPLFMDGGLTFGQLLVDKGKRAHRKKSTAQLTRFALQLKLSDLGEMRMDLAIYKGALTGTIAVTNDEAKQSLSNHMGQLKGDLLEKGFRVRRFSIEQVSEESLAGASLVDDIVEGFHGTF